MGLEFTSGLQPTEHEELGKGFAEPEYKTTTGLPEITMSGNWWDNLKDRVNEMISKERVYGASDTESGAAVKGAPILPVSEIFTPKEPWTGQEKSAPKIVADEDTMFTILMYLTALAVVYIAGTEFNLWGK